MDAYQLAGLLPSIDVLRQRCQALAVLDRILGGEDVVHRFEAEWGSHQAAVMDSNGGDEWAVVFTANGCFIRVFDHESPMSPWRDEDMELWPGLVDGLPEEFHEQLEEPAFCTEDDVRGYAAEIGYPA